MLQAFRADPCRFLELLWDPRGLYRILRNWRRRGSPALRTELAAEPGAALPDSRPTPRAAGGPGQGIGVLVVDRAVPRPDRDAGGKSSYLYLQLLCEMGYEVFFLPNDQLRREPYASVLESLGVQLLIGPQYRCGGWVTWLHAQGPRVRHIVLHRPNVAKRYLKAIRRFENKKLFYVAHDLRSLREQRQFALTGDVFHQREARYWEGVERAILAQADVSYFFSAAEVAHVADWTGGSRARALPLYPQHLDTPPQAHWSAREGLLFVGGFAHQPNLDAVLWFATHVWPLVRLQRPGMRLRVVGAEPPRVVLDLAGDGIEIAGAVSAEQLAWHYRTARLMVAPLRFGAGIKGKVVEAMGLGLPVVSTPIGAEGIPDASSCLALAQSASEMAALICALDQDDRQCECLRARALQVVAQHFSREAAYRRLASDLA